ncbi:hypothetical protein QBC36DRAFT_311373 [Triangularia setosa]|uniref:Uncharacterized protein n=1 Tax=Triangularia setosa TaxID=2587417 RepID=A0AAN7A6Q1_9PEZI|nr:hypothetical protein QBC36DRAFT_311373 [Podospora setosa]
MRMIAEEKMRSGLVTAASFTTSCPQTQRKSQFSQHTTEDVPAQTPNNAPIIPMNEPRSKTMPVLEPAIKESAAASFMYSTNIPFRTRSNPPITDGEPSPPRKTVLKHLHAGRRGKNERNSQGGLGNELLDEAKVVLRLLRQPTRETSRVLDRVCNRSHHLIFACGYTQLQKGIHNFLIPPQSRENVETRLGQSADRQRLPQNDRRHFVLFCWSKELLAMPQSRKSTPQIPQVGASISQFDASRFEVDALIFNFDVSKDLSEASRR